MISYFVYLLILVSTSALYAGINVESAQITESESNTKPSTMPQDIAVKKFKPLNGKLQEVPVVVNGPDSALGKGADAIDRIMSLIPHAGVKEALDAYKEILLGKDGNAYETSRVAIGNKGLEAHFNELVSTNECIENLASAFYSNIDKLDAEVPDHLDKGRYIPEDRQRPSQKDFAGEGRFKNLKPGFLWEMAMEFSHQNPHLAMRLISICGHDDVQNMKMRKICPSKGRNSILYLSKALGEEVDISPKLREEIVEIQAPNKGARVLPSKNYHVLGGAFMGCVLAENGMPSSLIAFVEGSAATAYRGIRLHELVEEKLKQKEEFVKKFERLKSEEPDSYKDLSFEQFMINLMREQPDDDSEAGEMFLADLDAAVLYDYHHLGGSENQPFHLPIKRLEHPGLKAFNWLRGQPKPSRFQNWSQERYDRALAKYNTWAIDIEWTREQHEAGARFAKKHCTKPLVDKNFTKECSDALTCGKENQKISTFIDQATAVVEELKDKGDPITDQAITELVLAYQYKHGKIPSIGFIHPSWTLEDLEKAEKTLEEKNSKYLIDLKTKQQSENLAIPN